MSRIESIIEPIDFEEGVIDAKGIMHAGGKVMNRNEVPYRITKGVLKIPGGSPLENEANANELLTRLIVKEGVTHIAKGSFHCYSNLRTVSFPNSLLSIGAAAFSFTPIRSLTIPDGVVSIGVGAFEFCLKLRELKCGSTLKEIGVGAFSHCKRLSFVESSKGLVSIGERAFLGCNIRAIQFFEGLSIIGEKAFAGNKLRKIVLPNSVISIGNDAFDCDRLLEATIPVTVANVGNDVFPTRTKIIRIRRNY